MWQSIRTFFARKIRGYRTVVVNAFLSIVPILELTEVRDVMPDDWLKWYALVLVFANMYLRSITKTPMGKRY